jgi:hypothetical protein
MRYTENGLEFLSPDEVVGEGFWDMTPAERRQALDDADEATLKSQYADAIAATRYMEARGDVNVAGGMGTMAKMIADPAAFVPIAGQAGKVASVGYKASSKAGAKIGAGWGGAYGTSKVLAEEGAPTTKEEWLAGGKTVAKEAALGAVGGAVLGPAVKGIGQTYSKGKAAYNGHILSNPEKAVAKNKEYMSEVWKNQAVGMTSSQAETAARKSMGYKVDEIWQMKTIAADNSISPAYSAADAQLRLSKAGFGKASEDASLGRSPFAKGFNYYLQPTDAALRERNAWVAQRMKTGEADVMRRMKEYDDEMRPFVSMYTRWFNGMDKESKFAFDQALRNNDRKGARDMFLQNKQERGAGGLHAGDVFDNAMSTMDKLAAEAKAAGIKFDEIEGWFPRVVKRGKLEELKKAIGSNRKLQQGWAKYKARATKRAGRHLSKDEEEKLLNRFMSVGGHRTAKSARATKERSIRYVTNDLAQYYEGTMPSLQSHMRDTIHAIERYKLFGKDMKVTDDGIENLDDSIGAWLLSNNVHPDTIDGIVPLVKSRFGKGEEGGAGILADLRNLTSIVTLGNPVSAIRSFGDTFTSAAYLGMIPTLKSMPKAALQSIASQSGIKSVKGFDADQAGFMLEVAQQMDMGGVGSRLIKRMSTSVYNKSGFRLIDRMGKNVVMGATIRVARKAQMTVKGRKKFMDAYGSAYGPDDIKMLMADLKAGKLSEIVKQHVVAEVMEIQPVSRLQMPQAYLDHPNGRALYQFRSWGLKQFDLMRHRIFKDMFDGSASKAKRVEAAGMLMYTSAVIGTGNSGITEFQRFVTGRDSKLFGASDFVDDSFWQFLGNMGINRYGLEQLSDKGDVDGFWNTQLIPPAISIPSEMGMSAFKIMTAPDEEERAKWNANLRKTTGIGRMLEWLAYGGAEKENLKIYTEFVNGSPLAQ